MMKSKKPEQQKRPWIAFGVTIAVLCLLIYAGTLEVEELKQESQQVEKAVKKSGGHAKRNMLVNDGDSASESSQELRSPKELRKEDEASLIARVGECPIDQDAPDPYTTKKSVEQPKPTKTGAWELPDDYDYFLDIPLAQALSCIFENDWVLELGAGTGHYTRFFLESEKLKGIRAYDGAINIQEKSGGLVKRADLTKKKEFGGPYDWVLCLDVAEHIPKDFEEVFLDNIHRHAKKGVIISWARPGIPGVGHVNAQEPQYVKDIFKKMGYVQYPKLQQVLRKTAKLSWLRHNILVFVLKSHECTNC
eukprot:TRINITY_DN23050_c0_g1_i1.p1 TRINITY_DN23050_c0_g1~~TRINITY_DN23050_c0_g1_i1.p1  ORF type:complete len:306 (+),score=70.52 TRINITY_DN23050_c0_g1_i1:106-1023(+)